MLQVQNLSFSYADNSKYVIDDMSFKIYAGEYISVLGENGCGKSTLTKLILKLLTPQNGTIDMGFKRIGYVPQRLDSFNSQFPLTVCELLNCTRKTLKIKDKNIIDQSLEMVRMQDFKECLIGTLSGGQFQKILIARALIGSPDLLILDEPSNGIDVRSQDEIYSTIKALNKNSKLTVISVEHNVNAALNYSSSILYLHSGKAESFTPEKYSELTRGGNLDVAL
jgi:zinc transport system ATP-binding protein